MKSEYIKVSIKNREGCFTGEYKNFPSDSKLALAMIGKKVGDEFEFSGMGYEVVEIV